MPGKSLFSQVFDPLGSYFFAAKFFRWEVCCQDNSHTLLKYNYAIDSW